MLKFPRLSRFHDIMDEYYYSKHGSITRHQEVVSRFYDEGPTTES